MRVKDSWCAGGRLHTSRNSDSSGTDQRAIGRNHHFMNDRNWATGQRYEKTVRAIWGGAWLKGWSASMKIVKIQICAGPISQITCSCIPPKGNVIVKPGFPWREVLIIRSLYCVTICHLKECARQKIQENMEKASTQVVMSLTSRPHFLEDVNRSLPSK